MSITQELGDPTSNLIPLVDSEAKEHAKKGPVERDIVLRRMVVRHGR